MSTRRDNEIDEVVREFLIESRENLDVFESTLLEVERAPGSPTLLAALFRSVHSIKGSCGFLHFTKLEALLHAGETLLARLRDGQLALDESVATALLRMVDSTRRLLGSIDATGQEGDHDTSVALTKLEAMIARARAKDGDAATEEAPPELDVTRHSIASSGKIRVDVGLLDRLMNLVGELVLARNQVVQHSAQRGGETVAPVQRLSLVTTELQETVMKTRMQPIDTILGRFPRLVRDLSAASGKRVRLQLEGRQTELDKSIIEAIQDPLTHLVRNAIDHGIESANERAAAGKNAEGTVSLRAFHEGGMVNIEVSDDGVGVDVGRVKTRALQLGLLSGERLAQLTEREALGLIFEPGFTTAQKVTTVSGRGVGMDVVRTNIEKIGGTVEVHTRSGAGTTIKIKIPLTLAIIPALIVTSGGARYAIPQTSLDEVVRLETEDGQRGIEEIQGAPVFRLRGRLLPIAYLSRELGVEAAPTTDAVTIVVLQTDERTFGLVVDEIRDTEEIVVKPLWKRLKRLSCYAGATVMGDGKVALILDPMGLGQRLGMVSEARQRVAQQSAAVPEVQTKQDLILLCRLGGDGRLAIPLANVARLEEFDPRRLERVGDVEVAQYRGEILPLMRVSQVLQERRRRPREPKEARSAAPDENATLQVVVFAHDNRRVGLVVDGILDILGVDLALQDHSGRNGILGTMVVQERVTEFLDVAQAIRRFDAALAGPAEAPPRQPEEGR